MSEIKNEKMGLTFFQSLGCAGCGGVAATLTTHPMDVLRVRLQLDSEAGSMKKFRNPLHCAVSIWKQENGIRGLYVGISAGIARTLAYGMTRMGLYSYGLGKLNNILRTNDISSQNPNIDFKYKVMLGSLCGGIAATIGVPTEVALVRMTGDAREPDINKRRQYKHVFDAIYRIIKEEGFIKIYSGLKPTVVRGILLNAGQLSVYSEAKVQLNQINPNIFQGIFLQFSSSLLAATAGVGLSGPADVIKSRIQHGYPGQYHGIRHCAITLLKHEGIFAFYKGAGPSVMKLAPYTVVSFLVLDNLSKMITGKEAM